MKKLMSYSVVLFVITVILLLIIPMPAGMVDVAIILNMSFSMMILVITMTIREPLEFSIFPSLLLITTLFRLGINVSSTRNILSHSGSSGKVIAAFGDFVLQGNVVVGMIIFLIIVLMQFIVITKGAERVAEVAARFTLDAMPGKQMAIDADLSSGLINEQQAKEQRSKIQREADFYGSMDGATKIVKGDAIMSLITTAINLIGGGYYLSRRIKEEPIMTAAAVYGMDAAGGGAAAGEEAAAAKAPVKEEDYFKDVNNVYSLLSLESIEMEFGYSLIPLADESSGGRLISRIVIFRRQYAQDMGYVVPSIRLRDSSMLAPSQYCIKIRGEEVARGEILVDYFLALEPETPEQEVDGIETIEPAYGIPSRWIRPENRERAELYGYTVIDPLSVMVTHLSEVIRQHAFELITRQEVVRLVENLKKTAPELVEEAFPQLISYSFFQRVLTGLLKENVPIRDLETIVETLLSSVSETGLMPRDTDGVIERIRTALKRTITRMYCEDGTMKVLTLDAELERDMVSSLSKGENGFYLALDPDTLQSIIRQLAEQLKKFSGFSQDPVVLTSQVMRIHFYRLTEQFYPKVRVLSFNEVASNVQIQSIGSIKKQ